MLALFPKHRLKLKRKIKEIANRFAETKKTKKKTITFTHANSPSQHIWREKFCGIASTAFCFHTSFVLNLQLFKMETKEVKKKRLIINIIILCTWVFARKILQKSELWLIITQINSKINFFRSPFRFNRGNLVVRVWLSTCWMNEN